MNTLFSKITFQRLINASLNYFSFYISFLFKHPFNLGFPTSITIEPTNFCNLKCPECPSGTEILTRNKGFINEILFQKIIDETYKKSFFLTLHFQGEPYLHNNLFNLIKYASNKKLYTTLSTNGHFLSEENCLKTIDSGLDKLIISLDGTTSEIYSKYRINGSFDKVVKGIETIFNSKKNKKPLIILQFIVFKSNEHQIDEMKQLAGKLKIDKLEFKSAQIYNFESDNSLIPSIDKYSRYKKAKGKFEIKNKLKNKCFRLWTNPVITWDGCVVPCCFDKDANYKFGNLNENTFKEIWNNSKYNTFRKTILNNRKNVDICRNCTE